MKKINFIAFAAGLFGIAITAHSATTAYSCNGCTLPQYKQTATNIGKSQSMSDGTIYIYDFSNNQFKSFLIQREPASNGTWNYYAYNQSVTAADQQRFDKARQVWALNGMNSHSAQMTSVPISINTFSGLPGRTSNSNGYGLLLNSAQQNDLYDCILTNCYSGQIANQTLWVNVGALLYDIAGIVFKDNPIAMTINVVMNDDSKVTVSWVPGKQPIITAVVDSNGNSVPLNKDIFNNPSPPYGSNYDFTQNPNDLNNFIQLARSYGVIVTVNPGHGAIVSCVNDPTTGKRVCGTQPY